MDCCPNAPTLALAFKLEEGKFGQLTYMRLYQVRTGAGKAAQACWLGDSCRQWHVLSRGFAPPPTPAYTRPASETLTRLGCVVLASDQGTISKGDMLFNLNNGKKLKVPRLVRMHAAEMEVSHTLSKYTWRLAECSRAIASTGSIA